jgi:betaine-aldehyde dehydrogenase
MSGGVKAEVKTYRNFVNGQWMASATGETFPVYDPSTEEVIARVSAADKTEVDVAVKAARKAFDEGPWSKTTAQDRGRVLFKLAEKIRQNAAALADLESRNTGKPIVEAEYDIVDVATCFEYYGGLATKIMGHVNPVPANALSFTLREPVGVAAQIIPWNYPLLMAAWKLAPALAAGCTCILKPAEQTPLTALVFANWFEEVGLPPGVVNIINGFGETAGAALVAAWVRLWLRVGAALQRGIGAALVGVGWPQPVVGDGLAASRSCFGREPDCTVTNQLLHGAIHGVQRAVVKQLS